MATCAGCPAEIPPSKGGPPRKWCSERCRKDTCYVRHCLDCGARLSSSDGNGPNAPIRCLACAAATNGAERKVWHRPAVIEAIQAWEATFGEHPAAPDWGAFIGRKKCGDAGRKRRYDEAQREGRCPNFATVVREFGSWNAGIRAAGFEPRAPHGGDGNEHRRRAAV